jgi:hypothetical protein
VTAAARRRRRANPRTGKPYVISLPPFERPGTIERKLLRSEGSYDVFAEVWDSPSGDPKERTRLEVARTKDGDYIGEPSNARYLCDRRGIVPQKNDAEHCVCSVGRSTKDGKWYGWSHRAIHGFAPGDVIREGHIVAQSQVGEGKTGFEPGHVLADEVEAERAARLFAGEVS